MHPRVRLPSQTRRFDGDNFLRLASSFNRNQNAVLNQLAKRARLAGYNARIVKNKHSSSVYVKPRKYNAPIPETDPIRQATFPTAMQIVSNKSPTIKPGEPSVFDELPTPTPLDERGVRIATEYEDIVKSQISEILQELQDIRGIDESIKTDIEDIQLQSALNEIDISSGELDFFGSNLEESQWKVIENKLRGTLDYPDFTSEEMRNQALGDYAWIQDPDLHLVTRFPVQQKYVLDKQDGGVYWLMSEDGVLLRSYSQEFVDAVEERVEQKVKQEYREQMVYGFRELGVSEHQIYAGIITEDREERIKKKTADLTQYEDWEGYAGAVASLDREMFPPDLPKMIDLPEIIEPELMTETEATEIIENVASNIELEEITIKANNIREVLETLGLNRREVSPGQMSTLNEMRTGPPIYVSREDERITSVDAPPGTHWVRGHWRKSRARTRKLSEVDPQTRIRYTRPKTGRNSSVRNSIANYIWREVYVEGGDPPTTGQIVKAVNEKSRWGATTQQVTNILAKDKTFAKAGFDRNSKNETWKLKKPEKT